MFFFFFPNHFYPNLFITHDAGFTALVLKGGYSAAPPVCVDGQLLTRRDKVRYGLPRTVGGADCIGRPGEWTRQLRYDPPAGEEGWSTAAAAAPPSPHSPSSHVLLE